MSLLAQKEPNPFKKFSVPFVRPWKVLHPGAAAFIFNPSSVLRPHPQLLRARGDVFLLRPLGHPGHAALPVVEEAHHAATAGGFIISSQNLHRDL